MSFLQAIDERFSKSLQLLDRLAGGNLYRVSRLRLAIPGVRKGLKLIILCLLAEFVLTLGFSIYAFGTYFADPAAGFDYGYIRTLVLLGLICGMFYFFWRMSLGYYWAYRRLTLFGRIAPILALSTLAIPSIYPSWVYKVEQIIFAVILLLMVEAANTDSMRFAFRPPDFKQKRFSQFHSSAQKLPDPKIIR